MDTCKWSLIDNETSSWQSGCGKEHFMSLRRTPIENDFKVCPYCAKKLGQKTEGYIPNYDNYKGSHVRANLAHLRRIGVIKP